MSKVDQASQSIQNLIWLIETDSIILWVGDGARREILAMLRFYLFSVTKGVTPEAAAEAALEFVASIEPFKK